MPYKNPHYHRDYFRAKGDERRAYLRERYKENPQLQREASKRWREAHPEEYAAQRRANAQKQREFRARHKQNGTWDYEGIKSKSRRSNLKHKFGLSLDDYDRMLASQNGVCAICGGPHGNKLTNVFNVDHYHATGAVRSLLCHRCNNGLGCFSDKPALLFAAAQYILRHQSTKEVA